VRMMKHTLLFATVVLMLVTVGRGAEPWKTKPVKEWNREETQDFLRSSPWVKQVSTVSLVDLTPSLGNTETTEGRGESSGAEQVPSTETIEAARGRSRLPYFIEWSSAKVREPEQGRSDERGFATPQTRKNQPRSR
jgi:hypothetical protein